MQVLHAEEERFAETLEHGMKILDAALAEAKAMGSTTLSGVTAFTLYDTYGFPLDLTADICRERGVSVDQAGFDVAMEKQREQARAASTFKMVEGLEYGGAKTVFDGYDTLCRGRPRGRAVSRRQHGGRAVDRPSGRGRARPHAVLCRVGRPGRRPRRAVEVRGLPDAVRRAATRRSCSPMFSGTMAQ